MIQSCSTICLVLMLATGLNACPGGVHCHPRTPVEVWCVGDDALTLRLRDGLEQAFQTSANFRLSAGEKPGTLVVTIPTNVDWRIRSGRTWVLYSVEFATVHNRLLGQGSGACREHDLKNCVEQILRRARTAVHRLRRRG